MFCHLLLLIHFEVACILHASFIPHDTVSPSSQQSPSMSSFGLSSEDLLRKLGLIAPLTNQNRDWNLRESVRSLYLNGIDRVAKQYHLLSDEDIRASKDLHDEAVTLLNGWAPLIWGPDERSWLMKPGDRPANGHYPAHLFWDEPRDRAR